MITRAELEIIWSKVEGHLESAARLLPDPVRTGDEGGTIEGYREFLAHNELELAFDELEALGDANKVTGAYWEDLASAAALMGLDAKARRCRSRVLTTSW
jgi:hypothetical protein